RTRSQALTDGSADMSADHGANSLDHGLDVGVGHARPDRQRDDAAVLRLGGRKIARPVAESPLVGGMEVKGDEVHAGADAAAGELCDDPIAVAVELLEVEAQRVEVPAVRVPATAPGQLHRREVG